MSLTDQQRVFVLSEIAAVEVIADSSLNVAWLAQRFVLGSAFSELRYDSRGCRDPVKGIFSVGHENNVLLTGLQSMKRQNRVPR